MDARNIYRACSHARAKVDWEKFKGSEWYYVGEGNGFKEREVQQQIDKFFQDDAIYLVVSRHQAFAVERTSAARTVKNNLTAQDIVLCDKSFKSMIVFSHIGVAKCGRVSREGRGH